MNATPKTKPATKRATRRKTHAPQLRVVEGALSIYRKGARVSTTRAYSGLHCTVEYHEFEDGELYLLIKPEPDEVYRVKASDVVRRADEIEAE
jgi:hypothetical protein